MSSLIEFPIKRYQFTLVAFLFLIALGIYTFMTMPREEDPSFKISGFQITAIMPGADPKDMERLVAKPLEDKLAEIDDLFKIESSVLDGVSVTFVEFFAFTDPDEKYNDVTREVNALRPSLPVELRELNIRKFSPGLVSIVQYALVSEDAPYRELEDQARLLRDALKGVSGVRTAESWAYPIRELRVELDLPRMAQLGLNWAQVFNAVQSENANIPAGNIDMGSRSFSLKTSGSYRDLDQVRDTVVAAVAGRIVRVGDVAQVRWGTAAYSYTGRYNGKRAVFVTANMKENFNILAVKKRIDVTVARFAGALPARIQLENGFDQSQNVSNRLSQLYVDFAIAIALVLLTLLPLGLRAATIVMISIPLSLGFGVACLYFLGYSLNQLSIAGFVLALGLLVDDSIVATENIARHLRMGKSRIEAALAGTRQIMVAILGCTATLIFAFMPLLALPGTAGMFIRVLPLTVVVTIIGSLLVAIFIIPFLASRLLNPESDEQGSQLLQKVMAAIHRYYRPALHWCLARPRTTVIASIGGSLLLSIALIPVLGSSLFPKADATQFLILVDTPNGTSLAETDRALRFVEERVRKLPNLQNWFTNLGHGNPQVYYNHIVRQDSSNYGEIMVRLKEYNTRTTPRDLESLRSDLAGYPGARIEVKEFQNGPPVTAPVAVRIVGPDLDVLSTLATQVETLVEKTAGTRDVRNPLKVTRTNLKLNVDSRKAAILGVPAVEFDRAVRLSVSGIPAGTFKDQSGEQYPIVVRTPLETRADLATLGQIRVPSLSGASLPISQLANLEFERAPTLISRYGRERSVTINSQVKSGFNTGKVTADVERQLREFNWPRGYTFVLGGEAEAGAEAFSGVGTAAIVAIFGIFAILVLEFGSFKSTLIVLTVVPLGLVGGFTALLLTGNDISFAASIGFIALVGIEIKNSILFVDFTNQLREQGVALDEAIERAGEIRFLPILLTSVTAIGGLFPLAIQNIGIYSPMAWVIIGGLVSSTLLARLVTPVMYKLIPPEIEPAGLAYHGEPNAPAR